MSGKDWTAGLQSSGSLFFYGRVFAILERIILFTYLYKKSIK
jgi:hypothetical protein